MNTKLDALLDRSALLQSAIDDLHEQTGVEESLRSLLAAASSDVAREHAISLRVLIELGAGTSAISLLRLQYEAITRAIWLTWAADDVWLHRLSAEPSKEAEDTAGKLPLQTEMLKQLKERAPVAACEMLDSFKRAHLSTLNSFVHGGLHPLARAQSEYPTQLLINVIECSNALSTMGAMLTAIWANEPSKVLAVNGLQKKFHDCLPTLHA